MCQLDIWFCSSTMCCMCVLAVTKWECCPVDRFGSHRTGLHSDTVHFKCRGSWRYRYCNDMQACCPSCWQLWLACQQSRSQTLFSCAQFVVMQAHELPGVRGGAPAPLPGRPRLRPAAAAAAHPASGAPGKQLVPHTSCLRVCRDSLHGIWNLQGTSVLWQCFACAGCVSFTQQGSDGNTG